MRPVQTYVPYRLESHDFGAVRKLHIGHKMSARLYRSIGPSQPVQGSIHADCYAGYEELHRNHGIKEVACMAHFRRKFVEVHRAQG